MALPLDRFLNLVYFFVTDGAEQQEKDKFDVRLNMPDERARRKAAVQGVDRSSPWSKENEEAALSGLVTALSGKA
jgi:hypothetical protein